MQTIAFKIPRILLGLFMAIIGLNKFLVFTEIPGPPGDGGELMRIYIDSGFLQLVGVLEMIGGIALLANRFVPVAVTVITAVMFNATLFHVFHDPAGVGPAAFCLALCGGVLFEHRERFAEFFRV